MRGAMMDEGLPKEKAWFLNQTSLNQTNFPHQWAWATGEQTCHVAIAGDQYCDALRT